MKKTKTEEKKKLENKFIVTVNCHCHGVSSIRTKVR